MAGFGIIALLVAALGAFGVAPLLLPDTYSWVEHGISESAAQGVEQAWLARLGFIAFGLAVLWLVGLRPPSWGSLATLLHLVFGVCMLGVAAFSARSWDEQASFVEREDLLHSLFASIMGVAFIVGVVALIVERRHRSASAALPDWVVLAVAAGVSMSMSASIWGLLQRLMFVTAIAWYGREAVLATRRADRS